MGKLEYLIYIVFLLLLITGCSVTDDEPLQDRSHEAENSIQDTIPEKSLIQPELANEQKIASITLDLREQIIQHKQIYPDTVGWLVIPDTTINNAVVQCNDPTNEYYLNHDLDGNPDKDGTYSAHAKCVLEPGTRYDISRNISLFAHNHDENPDGILFSQLKKYKDEQYARDHPYIFFSTAYEDMVWEVFAVYDTVKDFPYVRPNHNWIVWKQIIDAAQQASIYDYGVEINKEDKILTLSTCSFNVPGVGNLPITVENKYRFVVMARLVSPDQSIKEEAEINVRKNILLADNFPEYYDNFIYLNNTKYMLQEWYMQIHPCIAPIDYTKLERRGTIKRIITSNDIGNINDWDANFLPLGTTIFCNPEHPDLLIADIDGERLTYAPTLEYLELISLKLVKYKDKNKIKEIEITQETNAMLAPIMDMTDGYFLSANEIIDFNDVGVTVCIEQRFTDATYVFPYFLGTPKSVGKEVMIKQQMDGYYYKDREFFQSVLELFE